MGHSFLSHPGGYRLAFGVLGPGNTWPGETRRLPFGRIMDCPFSLYQQSQTFSPRLYKEQNSRLCIGPAVGFHIIPEEGL